MLIAQTGISRSGLEGFDETVERLTLKTIHNACVAARLR